MSQIPGVSTRFDPIQNSRLLWESSDSSKKRARKFSDKERAYTTDTKENNFRPTDDDDTEVRDKYALFDDENALMSELRTPKHRNSRSNKSFISQKEDENLVKEYFTSEKEEKHSVENNGYSYDVMLVILAFRYMSRRQRCLEYDGPDIQNHEFDIRVVKLLVCQVLRWMKANNLIQTRGKTFPLPLRSNYSSDETSSGYQASMSSLSDSFTYSTDSSVCESEECLDLSDYIAPKYVQTFLKNLDEATDLTPDYINAHNRTEVQNDDDGMIVELSNLYFVEIEIEKELKEIDDKHAAKFAGEKPGEKILVEMEIETKLMEIGDDHAAELPVEKPEDKIPTDLANTGRTTATDAFYNAVVAMACDISTDSDGDNSSEESRESTFDVQNARATVLQLVNQIQSQLPQTALDDTPQALPQVQQKIMNDLLILSQKPEPQMSYEISIDLQASVSTVGDHDCVDNAEENFPLVCIERCDSDGQSIPAMTQSAEETTSDLIPDSDVVAPSDEDNEEISRQQENDQGKSDSFSERSRGTIWRTLLERRQDSGRRSPYLQFKKSESNEEFSVGIESSRDAESKYLAYEYIRESHEKNNSIEVILKDNFEISKTDDMLTQATSHTDESTLLSNESLEVNFKKVDSNAMISEEMWTEDFRRQTNTLHVNQAESATFNIPNVHDDSFKATQNYLQDITWSMSPIIDPFSTSPDSTKDLKTESVETTTDTNMKTLQNIEKLHMKIETDKMDESKSGLPSTPDYWKALLTKSFSSSFEESIIGSSSIYVKQSTSTNVDSQRITKNAEFSNTPQCERIPQEDPSGHYRDSVGDYTDSFSIYSTRDVPREIDTLKILESTSSIEYYLGAKNAIENCEKSHVTESAKTIYFDTEDIKLCTSKGSKHGAIDDSESLPSLYFSLPSDVE